jgi:hypothetical protein
MYIIIVKKIKIVNRIKENLISGNKIRNTLNVLRIKYLNILETVIKYKYGYIKILRK